jgi:DNA-binding MarR family transcriptional regulator
VSYYSLFVVNKRVLLELPFALESMLSVIDVYNKENEVSIRCKELLGMGNLGSPATVHKNLMLLVSGGYVVQRQTIDGRAKDIMLTEKARTYFKRVEAVLEDVQRIAKKRNHTKTKQK